MSHQQPKRLGSWGYHGDIPYKWRFLAGIHGVIDDTRLHLKSGLILFGIDGVKSWIRLTDPFWGDVRSNNMDLPIMFGFHHKPHIMFDPGTYTKGCPEG